MEGTLWLLLGFLVAQCSGKTVRQESFNIPEPYPSLHDDIRLTPEQEMQMKERGFYTALKWPLVDNVVTVPYYFDGYTVPAASEIRTNFKKAAGIYEAHTCVRWVEVSSIDTRHKVKIFRDKGCWSNIGMVPGKDNELSLGEGCEEIGTMLHEMGHCLGLFHTQSRPDRDQYVRVWFQNVKPGMAHNFEKGTGDLYDVPYDYKSMMHYGTSYFSINGSYTLSTIDPYAMFAIGGRPNTFRYSDAAFLHRAYTCDKINAAKCPSVTCLNGGFVTQDCKCRCPENTVGDRCETVTGPFFSDFPKCGGTVTTEGEITSFIKGLSTTEQCIFKIEAPKCKLPSITFTYVKFYWPHCYGNQLTLEISRSYFGFTYCKQREVPIGKPITADSNQAALYFSTAIDESSEYGFKANIRFVPDPACDTPETTSSATSLGTETTVMTTTTVVTTTTATTETRNATTATQVTTSPSPASSCVLTELGTTSFKYTTPGFPGVVPLNTKCRYEGKPPKNTDVIFTRVQISLKLGDSDQFTIEDTFLTMGYTGGVRELVTYHLWPTTLRYTAGSTPGNGFSVTHTTVTGLPTPCNGETLTMTAGESKNFKNPLVGYTEKSVRCAFKIVAPTGKKMSIQGINLKLTSGEYFRMKPYLPDYDHTSMVSSTPITTRSNNVILYYIGSTTYSAWEIKVTVV